MSHTRLPSKKTRFETPHARASRAHAYTRAYTHARGKARRGTREEVAQAGVQRGRKILAAPGRGDWSREGRA